MKESAETDLRTGIQRLPAEVVARIAAGEMIARPSAAVKELVENALDAGATRITIRIEEAIDRYIEIADDGCGIPREELPLALERFTTNKIRHEEDLLAVESLGFRGEALASMAEIARVTVTSRARGAEHAWTLKVEAGRPGELELAARAAGTTVVVEDLFFNTPVRKRFLKKGPGEIRLAREAVHAYALATPGVAWSLNQDGRTLLDFPPAETLLARIGQIHGPRLAEGLLEVRHQAEGFGLRGYVGVPELARAGSRHQTFFVNGRWVAAPWLGQAVRQAYGDLIPHHQSPWAVLFLTAPPDQVDVNLHPTKREIRFLDERALFGFVQRAVRPAVARLLPRLFLGHPDEDAGAGGSAPAAAAAPGGAQGPAAAQRHASEPAGARGLAADGLATARQLYGGATATSSASRAGGGATAHGAAVGGVADQQALEEEESRDLVSLWQLHNRYVLAQTRKGLLIIDQHAAHERILYERILTRMRCEESGAQQLLFPVILELSEEEAALFGDLAPGLARMGFDCDAFEERSVVVRGIPPLWRARGEGELLRDLLDEAQGMGLREGETFEGLARAFACRAAIKSGEPLTVEEMNRLVDELFATETPHGDPHGRPTFVFLSLADLDRRFGRGGGSA